MSPPDISHLSGSRHATTLVVAGPAGSGKSTVFPLASFDLDHFCVDDRCAERNGGLYTGIPAAVRVRAGLGLAPNTLVSKPHFMAFVRVL